LIGIPDPPPRAGDEERGLKCSDAPLSALLPTEQETEEILRKRDGSKSVLTGQVDGRDVLLYIKNYSHTTIYQRRYDGLPCDARQIRIREEDQVHQVLVVGQSVSFV
jgi:hypothetical protein